MIIPTTQNVTKLTKNGQTPFAPGVEDFFWVTHSGAGGGPWGGDHPKSHGKPTITKEEDEQGAERVDAWIRSQFH